MNAIASNLLLATIGIFRPVPKLQHCFSDQNDSSSHAHFMVLKFCSKSPRPVLSPIFWPPASQDSFCTFLLWLTRLLRCSTPLGGTSFVVLLCEVLHGDILRVLTAVVLTPVVGHVTPSHSPDTTVVGLYDCQNGRNCFLRRPATS